MSNHQQQICQKGISVSHRFRLTGEPCQMETKLHLRDQPSVKAPPRQSVPLIPPYIFTGIQPTEDQGHGNPENMPTSKEKLVVCAKCNLCVHDTCYGSKPLRDSWICDRCASPDDSRNGIACCLCSLRGGALKQTTKGRWAHITCTLANNELLFTENRETIDLRKIDKQRYTLKCTYCGLITYKQGKDRYGACVQCTTGSCKKSFHLSCAQRAGLSIDIGKTPFRLSIACTKHKSSPNDQPMTKSDRPPIRPGSAVYARHKNSRYYSGSVRKIHNQLYYCVVFDDNSISRDLYPSDVTNFKARDGPPPLGSVVRVKWSDGVIYNGHFQGTRNVNLYTVEFEDGSEIQVEKEHVYTVEENLPHHVHKKLSVATEMKEDVFYKTEEELITDKRTRGVQVNYMYRFLNY